MGIGGELDYKDYYKTLGISKGATGKEIKAAYRRLARKFHPDMNKGDPKAEARFKEINEAHAVLSDPDKRRRYEQMGSNWKAYERAGAGGWPSGGGVRVNVQGFGDSDMGGFSDFFRTFFGGGIPGGIPGMGGMGEIGGIGGMGGGNPFAQATQQAIPPTEYSLEITLEEAVKGGTRLIQIDDRRVEVKIPAGIKEGQRIRMAGGSGLDSDIYLRIKFASHPVFERSGENLEVEVDVPLSAPVLGGEVAVPTLDGHVDMKIPAGTPTGRLFRLRGHGLSRGDGSRGDLLVALSVLLPEKLGPEERSLFEKLKQLGL